MITRRIISTLVLFVLFLPTALTRASSWNQGAGVQGDASKTQAPAAPPEQPPHLVAFSKASRISDPQEKLRALEKVIADFPIIAGLAEGELYRTLIKYYPARTPEILAHAEAYIRAARPTQMGYPYNVVASDLFFSGILIDEAEKYVTKGLALWEEDKFLENEKQSAVSAGRPAPKDEDLRRLFRSLRAESQCTLGLIYHKKGRTAEAEGLLKEAYQSNSTLSQAVAALGEMAEKSGDERGAVQYYVITALTGGAQAESRKRLEVLYRKTHSGSIDGLEETLDAKYRELFPVPVKVEHYTTTAARSKRVVLAEIFTGSGCHPCVAIDLAFDAATERYARSEMVVLMYHQHTPMPDPMANPSSLARGQSYGIEAVPVPIIDGTKDTGGGGRRENTGKVYARINSAIEKRLEIPEGAQVVVEAVSNGSMITAKATVGSVTSDSKDLKLYVALAENELRYTGENGVRFHPMVVRKVQSFAVDPSKPNSFACSFDVAKISAELKAHLDDYEINGKHGKISFKEKKHIINPGNLSLVAFVQDEKTKQVLQSAYVKVKAPGATSGR